ncbi:uncharacterized protein LOC125227442 [Leguminivora glycinivorella]|uniref:uncharacterized protein LOC125227442 n=1 Tax=Leguminivora glycinivorella TaxID=1035111 RepID=UPI00200E612F|nr:uncharacterized protein LOC125227442 [Leguminivora glycinivorella]
MLPGACLLFSFWAIFTGSQAVVTPIEETGPCAKFVMEQNSEGGRYYNGVDEVKFHFEANKNEVLHSVKNTCKALGSEVDKQLVEACNEDYHGETKPKLAPLGDEVLSPVYATCDGVPDCGPIVIRVTQLCEQLKTGSCC